MSKGKKKSLNWSPAVNLSGVDGSELKQGEREEAEKGALSCGRWKGGTGIKQAFAF